MSVENNNLLFDKVYNKTINIIYNKLKVHVNRVKYGIPVDYNLLKKLNLFVIYLENIKEDNYRYYYIENLTIISNYLNGIK